MSRLGIKKSLALAIAIAAIAWVGVVPASDAHFLWDPSHVCCHTCSESPMHTHASCPCAACPPAHAPLFMALVPQVTALPIAVDAPVWDSLHEFAVTISHRPEVPPPRVSA